MRQLLMLRENTVLGGEKSRHPAACDLFTPKEQPLPCSHQHFPFFRQEELHSHRKKSSVSLYHSSQSVRLFKLSSEPMISPDMLIIRSVTSGLEGTAICNQPIGYCCTFLQSATGLFSVHQAGFGPRKARGEWQS